MTDKELYVKFQNLFKYQEGKLIRKVDVKQSKKGDEAGTINGCGYKQVRVEGKIYLVHRIIWLLTYKHLPICIDHINHKQADNRIENLRAATKSQNAHNRVINKNSTTGVKGVSFVKGRNKWRAQIKVNCIPINLGEFDDLNEAKKTVTDYRQKAHGEYAHNG
tara:strand:- start:320 stop:808 length:489 start_codon:yes stop_codon:yes gene_type:complete